MFKNYIKNENIENKLLILFSEYLLNTLPKFIIKIQIIRNEIVVYVFYEYIKPFLFFLKNNSFTQFKLLVDITAVDYPKRNFRFEIVYLLLSVLFNNRLIVKTNIKETMPITSITEIFVNANWFEREIWDMFGIFFYNNFDLRRILTDYGFRGFPLRKDFPLTGYVEVRYDENKRKIITEPLELAQEYRNFDFIKSWDFFINK